MKRWSCIAAIAVTSMILSLSSAWADFKLSASLDSRTFTLDASSETVTATVNVFCDNPDPDASLVLLGHLLQRSERSNKTRVASSAQIRTTCLGEQTLALVFSGPFRPGVARFKLTVEACINTDIASCDATREQHDGAFIRVRLLNQS
jgi:hypothetical protein